MLTNLLIYSEEDNDVEEHDCRIWSPNQEWIFRNVIVAQPVGGIKNAEKVGIVGPGVNLNILSKVTSYKPTRPPLIVDITTENPLLKKRPSFAKPYTIEHKKIKHGPIPLKSQNPKEISHYLSPPGLRPALPGKIANNNKFLLLKHHKRPQFTPPFQIPEPNNPEQKKKKKDKEEDDTEEEDEERDLNSSQNEENDAGNYAALLEDYDALGDYQLDDQFGGETEPGQNGQDVLIISLEKSSEEKNNDINENSNSQQGDSSEEKNNSDEEEQFYNNANRIQTKNKYSDLPGKTDDNNEEHGLKQYSMFGANKPESSPGFLNSLVSQVRDRLPFFRTSQDLVDSVKNRMDSVKNRKDSFILASSSSSVSSTSTETETTTEKSLLWSLFDKIGR